MKPTTASPPTLRSRFIDLMILGGVALSALVGLDIWLHVAESLKETLEKPMPEISERQRKKVEASNIGKKAGQGCYEWSCGMPRSG